MIPFVAETRVETATAGRKMSIDKVVLNPSLDDQLFAKPAPLTAAQMPPLPARMVMLPPTASAVTAAPAAGAQHKAP
jgi:hypothetical protein